MNPSVYNDRCERLSDVLKGLSLGAVITSEISLKYLTGFSTDNGYLLITPNDTVFFTDSRYDEAAAKCMPWCKVVGYKKLGEELRAVLAQSGCSSLLGESERTTLSMAKELRTVCEGTELIFDDRLDAMLDKLRISKEIGEIELIKQAQKITEDALQNTLGKLCEGKSEREIALELEFYMRSHGAERVSFDLIVASGEHSSMPHAVPDSRKLSVGDLITFDIGAVVNGYHSDMTRTVAFGKAGEEQKKIYGIVLEAQKRAIDYCMNGGRGLKECDAAARNFIAAAGYGNYFGHSTGHGVGVEIHEKPGVSPLAKSDMPQGAVITVEPGIYLPGRFGVRIEDMLYITDNSAENLTNFAKNELLIV